VSRVVNPDNAGKERNRLTKAIVLALRELAKQPEASDESRDMAAFIALALLQISDGIDISVAAWEKRGYWVKADRFRMDWQWAGIYSTRMKTAIIQEDWESIAQVLVQTAQRLSKIQVATNHRLGKPWVGAYAILAGKSRK
jgi:hypothetical protein